MAQERKKIDFQTVSLFLTLAVLTGLFVLAFKWVLLTPDSVRDPAQVESASK